MIPRMTYVHFYFPLHLIFQPSPFSQLLHATATLRQLAIALPLGHKPVKSVSILHNLEYLIPLDPQVVKATEFVFQSGLLSLALPYRLSRLISGWKFRPISVEESFARWMELKMDQETSLLLKHTIEKQLRTWEDVWERMSFALEKLVKSGLESSGKRLRSVSCKELSSAREVQQRAEQAFGENCTSIVNTTSESDLKVQCLLAANDLELVQAYIAILDSYNATIQAETTGIEALFEASALIKKLIQTLVRPSDFYARVSAYFCCSTQSTWLIPSRRSTWTSHLAPA